MAAEVESDFFVSYTRDDVAWAEWIAWELEARGYTTIIQAWDFLPGHNFALKMQNAASRADRTLGVISPEYFRSSATAAEWAAALARDFDGEQRTYVPIRIREVKPDGLHRPIIYLDLFDKDEQAARAALLHGLPAAKGHGAVDGSERSKPATAPQFPGESHVRTTKSAPGQPAKVLAWSMPHVVKSFEGREYQLEQIAKCLAGDGRATVTQAQAIHGLGGVGKTQLVARYAELHRDEYVVGWWIRAEQDTTRLEDMAALGTALGLREAAENDLPSLANATREWLASSSHWLLVIDNAPNPDAAAELIPDGDAGHVLITSRAHADWMGLDATPLRLDVWERTESVEFLASRTGRHEPDAASRIAELLGDLPLALVQAAGYTATQGITLTSYLQRLSKKPGELLAKAAPRDYKQTVASTWRLAFTEIHRNSVADKLLSICAYLAPERIPRELLEFAATEYYGGQPNDEDNDADSAIAMLLSYGLLTVADDDTLDIHRLIQRVTRETHTKTQSAEMVGTTLKLLKDLFPQESRQPANWPVAGRLLAHILSATDAAGPYADSAPTAGNLLLRCSQFQRSRAELAQARDLAEQALKLSEKAIDSEDAIPRALASLSIVLLELGEPSAARECQERALKIKVAAYGPDHLEVAATLGNLGIVLRGLGELSAARECQERVLKIEEAAYGPDHLEVAATLGNLGIVLRELGELSAAREYQERVLKIEEAAYGPDHPEVASTLSNLGNVLDALGELSAAREHQERALKIEEAAYGPDHPEVARTLSNLGIVLRGLGELSAAREHQERALKIKEAAYGSDHPEVASTLSNLGNVLDALGESPAARSAAMRAQSIFERSLGPDHQYTLKASQLVSSLTS
jgi:tetratricopeptide (TPR) repeat protein